MTEFPGQDTEYRWRYYIPSLFLFVVSYGISYILIKNGKFHFLLKIFSFAFFINSVFIILGSLSGISLFNQNILANGQIERLSGLIDSANQAGQITVLGQLFILTLFFNTENRNKRSVLFLGYLLCVTAGIMTFSKAAFLNIIVVLLWAIMFIFSERHENKYPISLRKRMRFLIFIIVILSLLVVNFNKINDKLTPEQRNRFIQFSELWQGKINSETTSRRSDIIRVAWDYIIKDPIVGHGLGTFHSLPKIKWGTHNEFLLLWGEVGFVGFSLYVGFLVTLWMSTSTVRRGHIKFLERGLVLFLFITSFVTHNILNTKFLVLIIGFLLAVIINKHLLDNVNYEYA
ncbi:MAG TPA: O-antigen ligase family protein [Desulfobacteraceae bacterium]|nr:O-antigen ligase family protein [Desulfobacteraceae bacterium]HPQ27835.1 O-antigen ligase family protein [Desulfobacteraceae bacterium]